MPAHIAQSARAPSALVTALLLALTVSAAGCTEESASSPANNNDNNAGADSVAPKDAGTSADAAKSADAGKAADAQNGLADGLGSPAADTSSAIDAATTPVDAGPPPTPAYQTMTIAELSAALQNKDFDFINVHVPWSGQIPGTDVHIKYTLTDALEKRLGFDKGKKAILYCKTGPMSRASAKALVKRGYSNIWDIPSGMMGWSAAGNKLDWTKP